MWAGLAWALKLIFPLVLLRIWSRLKAERHLCCSGRRPPWADRRQRPSFLAKRRTEQRSTEAWATSSCAASASAWLTAPRQLYGRRAVLYDPSQLDRLWLNEESQCFVGSANLQSSMSPLRGSRCLCTNWWRCSLKKKKRTPPTGVGGLLIDLETFFKVRTLFCWSKLIQ